MILYTHTYILTYIQLKQKFHKIHLTLTSFVGCTLYFLFYPNVLKDWLQANKLNS